MPTPAEIISMVASLQNDTAQDNYTNEACLPYLNMVLDELQEIFEQNNVPVTNETSAVIAVVASASITEIGFTTVPALPSDLIEIQQLWESPTGQNQWIPMTRKEFMPHYLELTPINQFIFWVWKAQKINLPPSTQNNDIKIDYVKSIFSTPLVIGDVNTNLDILNCKTYLGYKTASLCSMFIGENETRAGVLNGQAEEALSRLLGISAKGRQAITTRRRPFRAGYKRQGIW
jgi:hypothetical protein